MTFHLKMYSLIGFAGAPWTLSCYMIEGKGSKDFVKHKNSPLELTINGSMELIQIL